MRSLAKDVQSTPAPFERNLYTMITIAIAEDQVLMRKAIIEMIERFGGFQVIAEGSNGIELIDSIQQAGPTDSVILDLRMPYMNGSKTAAWLRENHPGTKMLLLTSFDSEMVMIYMLMAGVRGFIRKDCSPDDLKEALMHLMEKDTYYFGDSRERLINLFHHLDSNSASLSKAILTEREIEFIKLACSEDTYKQIAEKMYLAVRTVDGIREDIFKKLQINSRSQLIMYALMEGVIDL